MPSPLIQAMFLMLLGVTGIFLTVPPVRRWAIRRRLVDRPDFRRKKHRRPVPRVGGVAIFAVVFVQFILWQYLTPSIHLISSWGLILTSSMIFAMGFRDDLKAMGAKRKLLIQVAVAGLAFFMGIRVDALFGYDLPVWLGLPMTVLWLISTTNIINLIDGIDGLAVGVCLFLMLTIALLNSTVGYYTILCLGIFGTLLGFLYFNFPPAKIFLGDGGAYFLGYLIGCITILNSNKGEVALALLAPFLALGLPILDTTFAIIRRGLRGVPLFYGDREHIHHKLVDMGISHRNILILLYSICAALSLSAAAVFFTQGRLLPLVVAFLAVLILIGAKELGYVRSYFGLLTQISKSVARRREAQKVQTLMEMFRTDMAGIRDPVNHWKYLETVADRLGFESFHFRSSDETRLDSHQWKRLVPLVGEETADKKPLELHSFILVLKFHKKILGDVVFLKKIPREDIPHFHRLCDLMCKDLAETLDACLTRS
ncbi:MAG: MraY family glycosyltransferase [Verrucomicrobiae bacterium]|nr:MraY family glycosyltransferase [Verrucomicrobiae bacterium]